MGGAGHKANLGYRTGMGGDVGKGKRRDDKFGGDETAGASVFVSRSTEEGGGRELDKTMRVESTDNIDRCMALSFHALKEA